jgi:hypothetical protein
MAADCYGRIQCLHAEATKANNRYMEQIFVEDDGAAQNHAWDGHEMLSTVGRWLNDSAAHRRRSSGRYR